MGVYIADPSARVAPDGRLYIYGSRDESPDYYCSDRYHVLSTSNLRKWRLTRDAFTFKSPLYAPDAAFKDGKTYLFSCGRDGKEYVAVSDRPDGEPLGVIDVPASSEWQTLTASVRKVRGVHALWVRFGTTASDGDTFQLDKISFKH